MKKPVQRGLHGLRHFTGYFRMNDYSMEAVRRHRETVPEGEFLRYDRELSPVSNTDPTQSRIVANFARQYGFSVPLVFTVAGLAGFQMEVSDALPIVGGRG
jgi:hypothetical protein